MLWFNTFAPPCAILTVYAIHYEPQSTASSDADCQPGLKTRLEYETSCQVYWF